MSFQTLIGEPAPAFTLTNYDGESYSFSPDEKSVATVIFFYPQSGSLGCTKEACEFRDAVAEKDTFKPGKVQIIGISPDSVEKQKAFVEKYQLTYPVLSDVGKDVFKSYKIGKGMFGLLDVARTTFVIDKKGIIRDALDATINYGAHSKFVEKWLDKLDAEAETAPTPTEAPAATSTTTAEPAQP